MKKTLTALLAVMPAIIFAQSKNFTIKASFSKVSPSAKVYLLYRLGDKTVKDSAMLKNGTATFTGYIAEPLEADIIVSHAGKRLDTLNMNTADIFSFFIDKGTSMISATDSVKNAAVTGTKAALEYKAYRNSIAQQIAVMDGLRKTYANASEAKRKDTVFMKPIEEKFESAQKEIQVKDKAFIKSHPDSYVSIFILNDVVGSSIDLAVVEPIYNSLSPAVRKSAAGQQMGKLIESARTTAVGAIAPDFTQADTLGNPVKLSSFRGKYVLIDFWASWCGPCRQENPNVVKAYAKFHAKGFEVLGISLDSQTGKKAWLNAIHQDGLTWTQVSDLKSWQNEVAVLYGIRAIPQNFLLDPDGKIIAKDLREDALAKKLGEIFRTM